MEQSPNMVASIKGRQSDWSMVAVVAVVGLGAMALIIRMMPEQNLAPTPIVSFERSPLRVQECKVGEVCTGPTIRAQDPEGDQVTIRFYDKATGQPVGEPIKAEAGEAVTPEFKFNKAGEQELYMVVEDGAGHTSKDYPVIIPVQVE